MTKEERRTIDPISKGRKINRLLLILTICLAALLGLSYGAARYLNSARKKEMRLKARIDPDLIYVYFKDINKKVGDHANIAFPERLKVQRLTRINLGFRQKNRRAVYVQKIFLSFPPNTQVFTGGTKGGSFWAPTGRVGAREMYLIIEQEVPPGADFDLPPLEIIFKHAGFFTLSTMISLKGKEVIADSCTLEVVESTGR